jgi:hypothetical protein
MYMGGGGMMSEKMVWENLLCGEGENSRDSILFACSIQDVVVIEHLHYHQRKIRLCDLLTKILNGGILYCQIAAIPCSQQFCNFVEDSMMLSRHPVRYNNVGLSGEPFPRKLEANHP